MLKSHNIIILSVLIASKYKDKPDNRANKSSQYRSTRAGASWSLQETSECSSSPSKAKGRGKTRQTAAKKSPVDKSRFMSTAERVTKPSQVAIPLVCLSVTYCLHTKQENCFSVKQVVRLDERDRYKQLVAQFTTLQTPDCTGNPWNTTAEEPLQVQTDFLTKSRSHPRLVPSFGVHVQCI